ncbi:hypothetical protein [Myxococcus landrumensis]|uniref:Uncharacterized protein n=1 Tax=Myxococcus landrumensis TaxID=2813577 RepID=A0ABX7NHZ2_9BACT|nr:hypothetical protein [Myxococcus landrumus]QSQ17215.1 hypothetical protein JY572_14635 [Myxococcus landrumus]
MPHPVPSKPDGIGTPRAHRKGMDNWTWRVALAQRLGAAERQMQAAIVGLDGSPSAQTRYARARAEYRMAEEQALAVLGASDALALVEDGTADELE